MSYRPIRRLAMTAASIAGLAIASGAQAAPITFTAVLDGPSENPPNASPATGSATVIFDITAHTMRVMAVFSDLIGTTTAAHIHCCVAAPGNVAVATATPSFPGFPLGVTAGSFDQTYDMTLASSYRAQFVTDNGGVAGAEALLYAGLIDGEAYFNVHSSAFPGGEIRGFLTQVPEPATLALFCLGLAGLAVARRRVGSAPPARTEI